MKVEGWSESVAEGASSKLGISKCKLNLYFLKKAFLYKYNKQKWWKSFWQQIQQQIQIQSFLLLLSKRKLLDGNENQTTICNIILSFKKP